MNVAFIPVRGGSKSVPLKNIKEIAGKPLVYWAIKAACECDEIDEVYVATDSESIRDVISTHCYHNLFDKLSVVGRSKETSTDTASTEMAMLEFAQNHYFDNIVLIQATSPLITACDLSNGFNTYNSNDCDSVLSVVRQKRFCWEINEEGYAKPINYNISKRPRRQEFNGYLVENGAFYITSRNNLLKFKNRLSGKICAVEMEEDSYYEIDEPIDWIIVEKLMNYRKTDTKPDLSNIKMFLTDCDGCLTDGGMYYSEDGNELKRFQAKDGYGLRMIKENGILTGMITGEDRRLNERRAEKLDLDIFYGGCKDKANLLGDLCNKYNVKPSEVVYVGDDLNDYEIMKMVGIACCPANAIQQIREIADYISPMNGGDGAIRDIIDWLLQRRDR